VASAIVSTSSGIMTDREARRQGLGGEVLLCLVGVNQSCRESVKTNFNKSHRWDRGSHISVKGPKGELRVYCQRRSPSNSQEKPCWSSGGMNPAHQLHGSAAPWCQYGEGVSQGFQRRLEIQGLDTEHRFKVNLNLNVGCNPVDFSTRESNWRLKVIPM